MVKDKKTNVHKWRSAEFYQFHATHTKLRLFNQN